jgi:hypothetical protein
MLTYFFVKGESENYFVAGRSLPLWVVSITLAAQSIDSNALLGNADLSYKYHFWDGGEFAEVVGCPDALRVLNQSRTSAIHFRVARQPPPLLFHAPSY